MMKRLLAAAALAATLLAVYAEAAAAKTWTWGS